MGGAGFDPPPGGDLQDALEDLDQLGLLVLRGLGHECQRPVHEDVRRHRRQLTAGGPLCLWKAIPFTE